MDTKGEWSGKDWEIGEGGSRGKRERKDRKALGLQHEQNPERISAGGDDRKETQHLTGDKHAEAHGKR